MKKSALLVLAVTAFSLVSVPGAMAQTSAQKPATTATPTTTGDQDLKLLREDIRSKKKQIIAANLKLTDTEATKFWPVYDQYTAELVKVNNDKYAVIKEYAENWGTMTNEQAIALANRSLAVDLNVAKLRQKYVPIFSGVIPGTKVATFFQLDRRIQMMIDIQLASQLPLVQDQQ